MGLTSKVIGHWTGSNQAWKAAEVHQRKDDGLMFTTGKDLQVETRVFKVDQHTATGSFFPQTRAVTAFVQDALYLGLAPAHKAFTAAGNTLLMAGNVITAVKDRFKGDATLRDGMEPVVGRFKQMAKDAVVLGMPAALGYYNLEYLKYAAMGVAGLYGAYSLHNPRGIKYQVSRLDGRVNTVSLNDSEASGLGRKERVFALLDGRHSLARILGMHCMGTTESMAGASKRFDFVDSKKED